MKKNIINILLILTILLFIIIKIKDIYNWQQDSNKTIKEIRNLNNIIKDNEYIKLKKLNSDVVGIIKVNNTNINYPIVQTSNNSFYMNHSFDKSYNKAGWIFLDYRNNLNILDKNTIIYGHARYDGTMFGSLKNVLNKDWYKNKDNLIINITKEKNILKWKIISIYTIEKEDYYLQKDFGSIKEYKKFLNTIINRSIYNFNEKVTNSDKILTLSTCYSINKRLVVHAKLI